MSKTILRCLNCMEEYAESRALWMCPCGGALDLVVEPFFPKSKILDGRFGEGLWRYREAIAVNDDRNIVSLGEPITPLVQTDQPGLWLKLDYMLPTGSFKDRGASVMLSKVQELGIKKVIIDSSGNAGAATAAYAARAGIKCIVYLPEETSETKIRQVELYGAKLIKVPGQRADAAQAAFEAAAETYYASHYWNPYFFEGTKTAAFEIWEQWGQDIPDHVIAPVGHGTMLLGLFKGFQLLVEAGVTPHLPKLHGIQTAACAPLVAMFENGLGEVPEIQPRATLAEGIVITRPLRWQTILEAVNVSGGRLLAVEEPNIVSAFEDAARRGILVEMTSATALAGYEKLVHDGVIRAGDTTVAMITGTGIKTIDHLPKNDGRSQHG